MKDLYFPHDFNARNDHRIKVLMKRYGAPAYGIFWAIVEEMHKSDSGLVADEFLIESIAIDFYLETSKVQEIIDFCIECGLFYKKDEFLASARVERNKEKREEISLMRSKAGKRSAEVRGSYSDIEQSSTDVEQESTNVEQVFRFVEQGPTKKRKEKEKEKENSNEKENINSNEKENLKENEKKLNKLPAAPSLSPICTAFAQKFEDNLKKNMPEISDRLKNGHLKDWADVFDKLLRIDKRPPEEIEKIIDHVFDSSRSWWAKTKNVRSPTKFRERDKQGTLYFDVFLQEMKKNQRRTAAEIAAELVEKTKKRFEEGKVGW